MGIINATPDSFSGDGLLDNTHSTDEILHRAVTQAQHYVAEGAAIIDVGGESTRPGAAPLTLEQELSRVIPIIRALSIALPKRPSSRLTPIRLKLRSRLLTLEPHLSTISPLCVLILAWQRW